MTPAETIRTAALRHLRNGGFKYDDIDLVKLFDTSGFRIENGVAIAPADFVSDARAAHPQMFYKDAMSMTLTEIDNAVKEMGRKHGAESFRYENERFLDGLRKRYGTDS